MHKRDVLPLVVFYKQLSNHLNNAKKKSQKFNHVQKTTQGDTVLMGGNKDIFFKYAGSDLACERRRADVGAPGIKFQSESIGEYRWERLAVTNTEGAESIGRPIGNYNTLNIPGLTLLDDADIADAANEISKELCASLDRLGVIPERLLVVGLGNRELTPDSVGPRVAERVTATMHVKNFDRRFFSELDCSEIAVCTPGVTSKTGMEAAEIVMAICERLEPDAVIAIDSLASRSTERLGKTIQISDTGIFPGSGIGNGRRPLNESTLGSPVIAIGVPTVINAKILIGDCRESDEGTEELFVSPKDIDAITNISSRIIAEGINQAFGIF